MYYKGWRNEDTVLEGNCMDFCFFFSWYLYTGFLNSGQPVLCIIHGVILKVLEVGLETWTESICLS